MVASDTDCQIVDVCECAAVFEDARVVPKSVLIYLGSADPSLPVPEDNYIVLRQADCLTEMRSNGSHLVPFPGTPHRVVSWVIEFEGVLGESIFDMVQLEAGDHG